MARTVRDHRLDNRTVRAKLEPTKHPYWREITQGAHLGYYRGTRVGKWVARFRAVGLKTGGYKHTTIGEADDVSDADGERILTFSQAQERARKWFGAQTRGDRPIGPYTVGDALDDYMKGFTGKSVASTRARVEAIIRPAFGTAEVAKLSAKQIADWHRERAASLAKLRTSKRATAPNVRPVEGDEAVRRRRSTANRDLTVLKAALNRAFRDGKAHSDEAWRKVKPFPKVDAAKLRYLSDDEARRLANACDPVFRPMVQAALLTGARYGELRATRVCDFDPKSRTLWLNDTKGGKPRVVYLEEEGARLFSQASAGKEGDALIFPRPDGGKWGASQQARPLAAACRNAKVAPAAGFHDLRRTYGARLAFRGVPMAIIAEALGHADERITRKHYAHLSPSYVADTVRANAAGLNIVRDENVVALAGKAADNRQ